MGVLSSVGRLARNVFPSSAAKVDTDDAVKKESALNISVSDFHIVESADAKETGIVIAKPGICRVCLFSPFFGH